MFAKLTPKLKVILALPVTLSLLSGIEQIVTFSKILSKIIQSWSAFEIQFYSALLSLFSIELHPQYRSLYVGTTIALYFLVLIVGWKLKFLTKPPALQDQLHSVIKNKRILKVAAFIITTLSICLFIVLQVNHTNLVNSTPSQKNETWGIMNIIAPTLGMSASNLVVYLVAFTPIKALAKRIFKKDILVTKYPEFITGLLVVVSFSLMLFSVHSGNLNKNFVTWAHNALLMILGYHCLRNSSQPIISLCLLIMLIIGADKIIIAFESSYLSL